MMSIDPITQAVQALRTRLQMRFDKRWSMPIVPVPLSSREFERVASATPFLAIGFSKMPPSGARILNGPATLLIVVGVKNPANLDNRFLGDSAGPGLFPSLVTAAALVNGYTKKDLCTFSVTDISSAYAEGYTDLSIATGIITVTTTLSFQGVITDPDELPEFAGFSEWSIDVSGKKTEGET